MQTPFSDTGIILATPLFKRLFFELNGACLEEVCASLKGFSNFRLDLDDIPRGGPR